MILRVVLLGGGLAPVAACGPLVGGAVVIGVDELVEEDRGTMGCSEVAVSAPRST